MNVCGICGKSIRPGHASARLRTDLCHAECVEAKEGDGSMTVLGQCPWCMTNVSSYGIGGMTGVQETIVVGEPRWWHQGCVADLNRTDREVPATGYTHGGGVPL